MKSSSSKKQSSSGPTKKRSVKKTTHPQKNISKSPRSQKNPPKSIPQQKESTGFSFIHFVRKCHLVISGLFLRLHTVTSRFFGVLRVLLPELLHCTWKGIVIAFTVVVLVGVLILIWNIHAPLLLKDINLYDEGVTLLGAKRFALGDIPYRDFFTIYAPLKFSLLGGVFSLFEPSLFVSRIFFALVSLIGFLLLFLFFLRESNVFFATIFTVFLALFGKFSLTPLFLILIAIWFAALLRDPQRTFLPFVGGILVALLFLLRIDFGGFTGISLFLLLLLFLFFSPKCTLWDFSRIIAKMLVGFSIIIVPVFVSLYFAGALYDFWMQAVHFPLFGSYQEHRHLPWEDIVSLRDPINGFVVDFFAFSENFTWFFWPIPFVFAGMFWVYRGIRKTFSLEGFLKNMLLASFALAGFLYASHRSDFGHVAFLNFLAAIFLLHLLLQFRYKLFGLLFVPIFFLLALYPTHLFFSTRADIITSPKVFYSFYPKPFPESLNNRHLESVLQYFSTVSPDEKVYVGVKDTSKVFVNNVMLPFLLQQPVATKYHELHTGIVTTLPVQREIIDELKDVDHIVLWDIYFCNEPNLGCVSSGVYDVDEYIQNNFQKVKSFGNYDIYVRK
jgi:hypothetical protein